MRPHVIADGGLARVFVDFTELLTIIIITITITIKIIVKIGEKADKYLANVFCTNKQEIALWLCGVWCVKLHVIKTAKQRDVSFFLLEPAVATFDTVTTKSTHIQSVGECSDKVKFVPHICHNQRKLFSTLSTLKCITIVLIIIESFV